MREAGLIKSPENTLLFEGLSTSFSQSTKCFFSDLRPELFLGCVKG